MLERVKSHRKAWATDDEIAWLRTIGATAMDNHNSDYDVKAALRGYIESAYKRVDWGLIDRDACILCARELLAGGMA